MWFPWTWLAKLLGIEALLEKISIIENQGAGRGDGGSWLACSI